MMDYSDLPRGEPRPGIYGRNDRHEDLAAVVGILVAVAASLALALGAIVFARWFW